MTKLTRYIRAFWQALLLTLQGKHIQAPQTRYPNLSGWVEKGIELTNQAFQAAERNGLNQPARQQIILHLDSRDISMQTILAAVRHNLKMEYPVLMKAQIEHNLTTLYAMNLNDQYRVAQLTKAAELPAPVREAVQQLSTHLNNIPPSDDP